MDEKAVIDNEIEAFLMKRKYKEHRGKTRYSLALEGNIDGIIIEGRRIKLRKAINIQIINMSVNGILLKADFGCFVIGDCFSLNLKMEDSEIQLNCEIVRIQNSSKLTEEYGCRITGIGIDKETIQENVI